METLARIEWAMPNRLEMAEGNSLTSRESATIAAKFRELLALAESIGGWDDDYDWKRENGFGEEK